MDLSKVCKDDVSESRLFSISIQNTIYSLNQERGETVEDFKIRLQKYFDYNGLNIEIV